MLTRNFRRLLVLAFTSLIAIYLISFSNININIDTINFPNSRFNVNRFSSDTCTPEAYASGSWSYHPNGKYPEGTVMTDPKDALTFSGFQSCASPREFSLQLGADNPKQYDRFPRAQSYQWIPGKGCERMTVPSSEQLVKHLVQTGGWYLVGDSITENHFFSLSCLLYPHVVAIPDYSRIPFDKTMPQNLYLSPSSPLISSMSLSNGFNMSTMPLVTYRRIDILFSKDELIDIHRKTTQRMDNAPLLFSEELVFTHPLSDYLDEFISPSRHFGTMIVSTAGHWNPSLFSGALDFLALDATDGNHEAKATIQSVLDLFEHAVEVWAQRVQDALTTEENNISHSSQKSRKTKHVVIRPYLPGHEDCHNSREAWVEIQPFIVSPYNWGEIWRFNNIFRDILSSRKKFPNIYYLSIDRPARLRPDAHTVWDCLHIMSGAGVLEGWSHYIWHFISKRV